jgi:hypothetical protein
LILTLIRAAFLSACAAHQKRQTKILAVLPPAFNAPIICPSVDKRAATLDI